MSNADESKQEQLQKLREQFEKGSVRFDNPPKEDMDKLDKVINLDSESDKDKE